MISDHDRQLLDRFRQILASDGTRQEKSRQLLELQEGKPEADRLLAAAEGVCPYEDCPYPVEPGDINCGNHEEWMT